MNVMGVDCCYGLYQTVVLGVSGKVLYHGEQRTAIGVAGLVAEHSVSLAVVGGAPDAQTADRLIAGLRALGIATWRGGVVGGEDSPEIQPTPDGVLWLNARRTQQFVDQIGSFFAEGLGRAPVWAAAGRRLAAFVRPPA